MRLSTVKRLNARQLVRAVRRKFLFRYTSMGFYAVRTEEVRGPKDTGLTTVVHKGTAVDYDDLGNPYLDFDDFVALRDHPDSRCITAYDDGAVIASNWFLRGSVVIPELSQTYQWPEGVHYSCRTHVDPAYRGRRLVGHLMHTYATTEPGCQSLAGVVYDWNSASIRAITAAGWRRIGSLWTCRVLGVTFGNRPPLDSREASA